MKNPLLLVLIVAWIALFSIIGVTGVVAVRGADRISQRIAETHAQYQQTERSLEGVRAGLDAVRISIRDYMLDPLAESVEEKRAEFRQAKSSIDQRLSDLSGLIAAEEVPAIDELRSGVDGYFESLTPILDAGPRGFPTGTAEMRRQLTVHRTVAAKFARQIAVINEQGFVRGTAAVEEARQNLTAYLWRLTAVNLILGAVVALLSSQRIMTLQRRDRLAQLQMARNEDEMRRLSNELVRAQEDERKSISRELHDEVGQTLTALGIEIGNIERLRHSTEFAEHVADAKLLAQETLKTVRNLAMGLRPTLLDDSGLVPALKWQVREFSKRTSVSVDLQIDGRLDDLPDNVSTCVYRVVQEALTNCARHAKASHIRVSVHGQSDHISLAIQDDGVGFTPSAVSSGTGILGIEERVRELGGSLKIDSQPRRGTLLTVGIPLGVKVL
jgi:signal transduction histidine kinase